MAILVNEFNPSVTILGTDYISQTDDKIRTIMDESKEYLESETQNAVTQMDTLVRTKINELASVDDKTYTASYIDSKILENFLGFNF